MVGSPTTDWIPILYADPNQSDPPLDHQTGGRDGDIVGNGANPAFYMAFWDGDTENIRTDGEIGFRLRVGGDANPPGFDSVFWVGIDANLDGKIDLFAGAISGQNARGGLFPSGNSANTSPSTTSIDASSPYFSQGWTAENYNWQPVTIISDPTATNFNLDNGSGGGGDHTDHFVSFKLPLIELVNVINSLSLPGLESFDDTSVFQLIAATSNQANSLNQDLNGIDGGINSSSTWTELGGFTPPVTSAGGVVPEPGISALLALAAALLFRRRR